MKRAWLRARPRCKTCLSDGVIKVDMHVPPDVYVPCNTFGIARHSNSSR